MGEEHPLAGGGPARQRQHPCKHLDAAVLWQLDLNGESSRSLVNLVLCFALIVTAASLIFRKAIMERYSRRLEQLNQRRGRAGRCWWVLSLGVLVSISSVGAGAVGVHRAPPALS